MLTDEEIRRIKEEEILRVEIQKELSQNKNKSNAIFSFLDTQHGMFIASAVILPMLVWMYAAMNAHYTSLKQKENRIERLENEITFRVSNSYRALEQGSVDHFIGVINSISAYTQFNNTNVQALMIELEKELTVDERKEIEVARHSLIKRSYPEIKKSLDIRGWLIDSPNN